EAVVVAEDGGEHGAAAAAFAADVTDVDRHHAPPATRCNAGSFSTSSRSSASSWRVTSATCTHIAIAPTALPAARPHTAAVTLWLANTNTHASRTTVASDCATKRRAPRARDRSCKEPPLATASSTNATIVGST